MVCSHRRSTEEGISAPLLPEKAEEVWNEPQHPQILLHLHCGEHPDRLHHRLVWKQATAKLCKGSCELPATLLEVSFPPSRTSTPGGVQGKPGGLSKTPATRPTDCSLLRSGRRLRSIQSRTSRLRDSFFPQAIRLMNRKNCVPVWLSGRALHQQHKRLWV